MKTKKPKPNVILKFHVSAINLAKLRECAKGWQCRGVADYLKMVIATKIGDIEKPL